ncbi:YciI family protein [Actinoplanes sp. RD1]|uniref:YciI family protein n=1 Tax=Actinoplanes sp. RD1 TaxID=3064538 RepID=UPI002741E56B|nr:YciI family protein [Actinoplanes sp. RD1]
MAKYLVLIYGDEREWEAHSPEELAAKHAAHAAFAAAAGPALVGGAQLEASATATTVRERVAGRAVPTDGPFPETKEVLGGYYLLEAPDLDTVIELAGRLPEIAESSGGIEIRPLVER